MFIFGIVPENEFEEIEKYLCLEFAEQFEVMPTNKVLVPMVALKYLTTLKRGNDHTAHHLIIKQQFNTNFGGISRSTFYDWNSPNCD